MQPKKGTKRPLPTRNPIDLIKTPDIFKRKKTNPVLYDSNIAKKLKTIAENKKNIIKINADSKCSKPQTIAVKEVKIKENINQKVCNTLDSSTEAESDIVNVVAPSIFDIGADLSLSESD